MKGALSGVVIVLLLVAGGWFLAFGATPPCEAMQKEALGLAAEKDDAAGRAISSTLGHPKPGRISPLECFSMAIRMKAAGRAGVTILNASP